ncbi:MAG: ABC transporter permease subunit, partial [Desulfobacterales bacterium]|nr:ABC transporter permease subunit [Desulfobacterales bacterium]
MNKTIETQENPSAQGRIINNMADWPWWLLFIALVGILAIYSFYFDETYNQIFDYVRKGIVITVRVTLIAYAFAITFGLLAGLGRVSKNPIIYNIATLYVQVMRGLPILVTILYIAFVLIPLAVSQINILGEYLAQINLLEPDNILALLGNRRAGLQISLEARGIVALSISYGAFSAEIFRAG